jgi:hypothetical protein
MVRKAGLVVLSGFLAGCGAHEMAATWNDLTGDSYPLDGISREISAGGETRCPELTYVTYAGSVVPYGRPVRVADAFVPRLEQFDALVAELAIAHYGRAPGKMRHFGALACRRVRGSQGRLSEHALGNAIDVAGFAFARMKPSETAPITLPDELRKPFEVSVEKHWDGGASPAEALHQRFLRALVARVQEDDVFRGVIGPGREGHANHLHFDQSPWGYALF